MRLFLSINLDEGCRRALLGAMEALRAASAKASLVRPEQLHLTLAFIGETTRLQAAKAALARVKGPPFELEVAGVGRFAGRRAGEDLIWAGVRAAPALTALAGALRRELGAAGFALDPKPFKPHLTLARRVAFARPGDFEGFAAGYPASTPLCRMAAGRLSLMESSRQNGRLVYTELDYKTLAT